MVPGRGSLAEVFPSINEGSVCAGRGACASAGLDHARDVADAARCRIDAPDFQWHVCRQAPLTEIGE